MDRADEYERARKNPIFGTDLNKPVSVLTEEVREKLTAVRGMVCDIRRAFPYGDRLDSIDGFLTTGIGALYHKVEEFRKMEVTLDDEKRGPSVSFQARGIGLDDCPRCFVCGAGGGLMRNVAAFVRSKEDGEKIVTWFSGAARLDFRPSEPNWIQVKVGVCSAHHAELSDLCSKTNAQRVIRELDIKELRSPVASSEE